MKFGKVRVLLACTLLSAALACSTFAQDQNNPSTIGIPAFSTVTNGPEQINFGNLNYHWEFPIVSKPGRGLPFHFALAYDSNFHVSHTLGWSVHTTVPSATILVGSTSTPQTCGNGSHGTKTFF